MSKTKSVKIFIIMLLVATLLIGTVTATSSLAIADETTQGVNSSASGIAMLDGDPTSQSQLSATTTAVGGVWSYPTASTDAPLANAFASGAGTETDPYVISTPQHLANLKLSSKQWKCI